MARVIRTSFLNESRHLAGEVLESFHLTMAADEDKWITAPDCAEAAAQLALRLSDVLPPLPEGFDKEIMISANNPRYSVRATEVTASYVRTDHETVNIAHLDFFIGAEERLEGSEEL